MFFAALIGWVFFRATSFGEAIGVLEKLFVPTDGVIISEVNVGVAMAMLAFAAWWSMVGPNAFEVNHSWPARRRVIGGLVFGAAIGLIVTSRPSPFLYFQF
jgi:hypothetical protein